MTKRFSKYALVLALSSLLAMTFVNAQPRSQNTPSPDRLETRCGWFSNPTPGNAWLYDRDGEWTIGIQMGYQAEGDWPEFSPKQWIKTNVNYGYGCACLKVRVDRATKKVIEIESARARPLSVCRRDRALRKWDFK
jgi:hypothetical protein